MKLSVHLCNRFLNEINISYINTSGSTKNYSKTIHTGLKRPEREADHCPESRAKVKIAWIYLHLCTKQNL
jgi:hypothetical protein